jgi:hypothetical protein
LHLLFLCPESLSLLCANNPDEFGLPCRAITQQKPPMRHGATASINPADENGVMVGEATDFQCAAACTARALQSGHGIPGAPHWQAREDGPQSDGMSLCASQTQ